MRVIDANVLIYAANVESPFHSPCRRLVDLECRQPSPAFLTWSICYEFLRVSTHPRVLETPWDTDKACGFLSKLIESPGFDILVATPRHPTVLARTISELPELRGNVLHDLHTAVLMREHGISRICTRDRDFERFPFLTVVDPLSEAG